MNFLSVLDKHWCATKQPLFFNHPTWFLTRAVLLRRSDFKGFYENSSLRKFVHIAKRTWKTRQTTKCASATNTEKCSYRNRLQKFPNILNWHLYSLKISVWNSLLIHDSDTGILPIAATNYLHRTLLCNLFHKKMDELFMHVLLLVAFSMYVFAMWKNYLRDEVTVYRF